MTPSSTRAGTIEDWRLRRQSSIDEARNNVKVFIGDRLAVLGVGIIVATILVALLAPVIAPYPAQGRGEYDASEKLLPPSVKHPFGTDQLGRDVLSRVIYGARIPLLVSSFVIAGCLAIGVPLGGLAGYYGGRVDELIMRVTDIFLAFPSILLAVILVVFLGPSLRNCMIALIVSWWPWYARLVRGVAISLRERPFVEAARIMGLRRPTVVLWHILPASSGPVIVSAALDMGAVILSAAGLSFIGLGAQPPTAEWGLMISEGRVYVLQQWWISVFPALAMFVLVLGINFVGDGLRTVFDPRSKT